MIQLVLTHVDSGDTKGFDRLTSIMVDLETTTASVAIQAVYLGDVGGTVALSEGDS